MIDLIRSRSECVRDYMMLVRATDRIGGFLYPEEGYLLFLLAQYGPGCGAIVELGSFEGRSTCWLALGTQLAGREPVTAIDTFAGSAEHQRDGEAESATLLADGTTFHVFERNIAAMHVESYVRSLTSDTVSAGEQWAGGPVRLLFIDASHEYECVSADFGAWHSHVVPGGLIAFHDYAHSPDVRRFCDELLAARPEYRACYAAGSILVMEKRYEAPR